MPRGPIRLGRLEILSWAQWVDLSPFCPGVSRDLQGALGGARPRNRERAGHRRPGGQVGRSGSTGKSRWGPAPAGDPRELNRRGAAPEAPLQRGKWAHR